MAASWFNLSWAANEAVHADIRQRLHAGLPVHIEGALTEKRAEMLHASLDRAGHWPLHRTSLLPDPSRIMSEISQFPAGDLASGVCTRFARTLADATGQAHLAPFDPENFYYHHHNQILLDEHTHEVQMFNDFLWSRDALDLFESLATAPKRQPASWRAPETPADGYKFGCPGTMGLTPSWYSPLDFSAPHTDEDGGEGDRQIAVVVHLTKDWDAARHGGSLVWCAQHHSRPLRSSTTLAPSGAAGPEPLHQ